MLVTTDVGIKDAAHHYAYACLVVASLTYTQTKEHGMDALMQIANNSIFAAKYGSISSGSCSIEDWRFNCRGFVDSKSCLVLT
jgi:hypothetical protein